MSFKFKLPIACKMQFAQAPYIAMYPNDYKAERAKESSSYKVLHIDLHGLQEPEETTKKMKGAKKVMPSPLGKALDEEDSDDEDHNNMGDGLDDV